MFFGEIVEPSTRALIDDELEDYPEYIEPVFHWEGDSKVPEVINDIFIIESANAIKLVKNCVLDNQVPIASIKNKGIEIFKLEKDNFLFTYKTNPDDICCGEVVQTLSQWILKAKHIYTVTFLSITFYQNHCLDSKPVSLLKCLSNNSGNNFVCEKLEQPNLITGFGANVLSYCMHLNLKKCSLYVLYIDNQPLDSISTKPLIELFKHFKLNFKENFKYLKSINTGNLYM